MVRITKKEKEIAKAMGDFLEKQFGWGVWGYDIDDQVDQHCGGRVKRKVVRGKDAIEQLVLMWREGMRVHNDVDSNHT